MYLCDKVAKILPLENKNKKYPFWRIWNPPASSISICNALMFIIPQGLQIQIFTAETPNPPEQRLCTTRGEAKCPPLVEFKSARPCWRSPSTKDGAAPFPTFGRPFPLTRLPVAFPVAFSAVALPLPCRGGVGGGVANWFADRIIQTPPLPLPLEGRGRAAHSFFCNLCLGVRTCHKGYGWATARREWGCARLPVVLI